MKNTYELTKEDYFLVVTESEGHESPNDWGNEDIFLVYDHRQFTITRLGFEPRDINNYLICCNDESRIDLRNEDFDKYWIFTVYAYIHSGISLSLHNNTDRFDTSSTGFILVEKEQGLLSIGSKPEAVKYAEGLVNTWNQYLNNEVYAFTVIEKKMCSHCGTIEEVEHDSCCGFYGELNDDLVQTMVDHTEYKLKSFTPTEQQG